jgi:glyoxylase-like metal-dependent hydrolase (beta-lactamase superfamily II)
MHAHHHPVPADLDEAPRRWSTLGSGRSRRDFIGALIGASWSGLALLEAASARAALGRAQAPAAPADLFAIEKVADGVYAALARPSAMINSNAAIFVNAADVLVVDTHSKPSAAAALIAQIKRQVTAKPVRYVVNSHFHWDHMQGNSAYRKAFAKVDFLATAASKQLMSAEAAPRLRKQLDGLPAQIETTRAALGKAADAPVREFYRTLLAEQQAYAAEMAHWSLELPTRTFDKELVIEDKAHALHLGFHGRAHTSGDVVVFCPQRKVVSTGDMIHGFLPYIADGYPREWPATIDAVGRLEFDRIVPGHGPVHFDRVRLRHMRDYLEELSGRVAEGKGAGKSVAELQRTITGASLRSLQTDGYEGLVRDASRRFTRIPGEPPIADSIRTNVAEVYAALDRR